MSIGKRILEFFAAAAGIVFLMVLVWFLLSGLQESGYEEEGTLVMNREQEDLRAEPAFVTKPGFVAGPSCAAQTAGVTRMTQEADGARMTQEAEDPVFAGPVHTRSAKGL